MPDGQLFIQITFPALSQASPRKIKELQKNEYIKQRRMRGGLVPTPLLMQQHREQPILDARYKTVYTINTPILPFLNSVAVEMRGIDQRFTTRLIPRSFCPKHCNRDHYAVMETICHTNKSRSEGHPSITSDYIVEGHCTNNRQLCQIC